MVMREIADQSAARALPGLRSAVRPHVGVPRVGLTGRLLVLIVVFVMTAQVMIFLPAVANMRLNWLRNHLGAASVAALAFEDVPRSAISDELSRDLLKSVGARLIVLDADGTRRILASHDVPSKIDATYDLRSPTWMSLMWAALEALAAPPGRILTFLSPTPEHGSALEVTLDEQPLQDAMHSFARRILTYSLIVSVIVAVLAGFAVHRMILRPMRRLTTSIVDFGFDPRDRTRIIKASTQAHEIGQAERALAVMQEALVTELVQKKNLANLGLAVAKINHDMRNMLATAQILSDRLGNIADPLAQRVAPKLVATLDRAIRFCEATLTYGRAADEPPRPRRLRLRGVVAEAAETVVPVAHGIVRIENEVPADLDIAADPEQMFRIMLNLLRNGVEALERAGASPGRLPVVEVRAWIEGASTIIEVADTGPGIPAAIRSKIFSAFQNSSRPGGTGLGLAIVADLVGAHGGTIVLVPSSADDLDDTGATFRITLPWQPSVR